MPSPTEIKQKLSINLIGPSKRQVHEMHNNLEFFLILEILFHTKILMFKGKS